MKNLNPKFTTELFNEFTLSNEEMINVRGGEGDVTIKVVAPPILI